MQRLEDLLVSVGDRCLHGRWEGLFTFRPPVDDLAVVAITGSCGGAVGSAVVPALPDGVGRQLPVGVASGGGGEGLFGCEVAEFELGVVVAVAHDVGVVGFTASGHADVQRRRGGAWGDDDVSALHGAALGASDRGRIAQHDVFGDVAGGQRRRSPAGLHGRTCREPSASMPVTVQTSRLRMRRPSLATNVAGVAAGLDGVTDVDPGAVGGVGDVLTEPAGDDEVLLAAGVDVGGVVAGVDDDGRLPSAVSFHHAAAASSNTASVYDSMMLPSCR